MQFNEFLHFIILKSIVRYLISFEIFYMTYISSDDYFYKININYIYNDINRKTNNKNVYFITNITFVITKINKILINIMWKHQNKRFNIR